ncbi:MAG: hypothetical protein RJB26_600 [Pseudomonadota bacterium]|jgi:kynureninase
MTTRTDCEALDAGDALAQCRAAFALPTGRLYLDGNSLGPMPRAARERVQAVLDREWSQDLIAGWNIHGWMSLPERLGARIAPLVGAAANEVMVADTTTVNLFKLVAGWMSSPAVRASGRRKVVTELGNFPTDLYVLQGIGELLGPAVEVVAVPRAQVLQAVDADTALLVLTHVHYKTADMYDLHSVTAQAHAVGAAVLWDLSHSVGAVPLALGEARADFAVGCTYKYLNGGPGSPAFVYVREDLQAQLPAIIAGWLGHAAPFEFDDAYAPAPGVGRLRAGTPGILGMAALDGALDVFDGIGLAQVRSKSQTMAELFIALVEARCAGFGLQLITPRSPAARGSHVSFTHPEGYGVMQALIARGVVGDFRAPDAIRFGFTPLHTRYVDLWDAVEHLHAVLAAEEWRRPEFQARLAVT